MSENKAVEVAENVKLWKLLVERDAELDAKDAEIDTLRAKVALQLVALNRKDEQVRELGEAGRLQSVELLDARAEIARLRAALEKIAAWGTAWPEKDPDYGSMAVVTARQVIPNPHA